MSCLESLPPAVWVTLGELLCASDAAQLASTSTACHDKANKYTITKCSIVSEGNTVLASLSASLARWPQLHSLHYTAEQARHLHKLGLHAAQWPVNQTMSIGASVLTGPYHEAHQFVAASLPLPGRLVSLGLHGSFRDQGWGNNKGRFLAGIMRCHGTMCAGSDELLALHPACPPDAPAAGAAAPPKQAALTAAAASHQPQTAVGFACVAGGDGPGAHPWAQCSHCPLPADSTEEVRRNAEEDNQQARALLKKAYVGGKLVSLWHSVSCMQLTGIAGHEYEEFNVAMSWRPPAVRRAERDALVAARARGVGAMGGDEGHESCRALPADERLRLLQADDFLGCAEAGDVVQLLCIVGGGGGHQLKWKGLQLSVGCEQ